MVFLQKTAKCGVRTVYLYTFIGQPRDLLLVDHRIKGFYTWKIQFFVGNKLATIKSMENSQEVIVVSVGGSLIVPNEINIQFLSKLKTFVTEEIQNGRKFIIVVGGGKTARKYQGAARELSHVDNTDIDRIGITAIKLNVHLMQLIFSGIAEIMINPGIENWQPGSSSDLGTVQIAKEHGGKKVVNLSNTDYIYDLEEMNRSGKLHPITDISWDDFIAMLPSEWTPGANVPFGPKASRLAQEAGIEVANINGQIIEELQKYLHGEPFRGTLIH